MGKEKNMIYIFLIIIPLVVIYKANALKKEVICANEERKKRKNNMLNLEKM